MQTFLLENWHLVALMLASGTLLVWPEISRLTGGGTSQLGTLEATRLLNQGAGVLVLDVRDAEEFAAGHLPRARNVPMKELAGRTGEFTKFKSKPVIVTCKSGTRGAAAVRALRVAGFEQVYQLRGGIAAWQQASLPLEK
jgi:rhodanese-related sulfurtransferase